MHRTRSVCTAVMVSAMLGCGGSEDSERDGGPSNANARVCEGDRWASPAAMLAATIDCTVITGNLALTGNELVSVELPMLTRVDGSLGIWGNPMLAHVSLPKLASIGGHFDVSSNPVLTRIEVPALVAVNDRGMSTPYDLVIRDNALTTCEANAIRDQLLANGFDGTVSIVANRGKCPP